MNFDTQVILLGLFVGFLVGIIVGKLLLGSTVYEMPIEDGGENDNDGPDEVMGTRLLLMAQSLDVIWNSLGISEILAQDQKTAADLKNESYVFPNELVMYSSYDTRGMKLSCSLNWSKQILIARLEQSFSGYVIEVKEKFKLELGVLSRMQVLDFADKYVNEITEVITHMQNEGKVQVIEEKEDKGEEE